MTSEEKKIIVDDDWKTRVQAEKESLSKPSEAADQSSSPQVKNPAPESDDYELPPPTFDALVSMLVTQALAALGQFPLGDEKKPVVMLDHAKHYIDVLAMLEEKTKGNLSSSESGMLTNILHELRMVFVAVQSKAK